MAATEIDKVAVVGAGTMGPGMAATFARNGFHTTLFDVKPEQLDKAKGAVRSGVGDVKDAVKDAKK